MKQRTKNILRELAKYLGLKIVFVNYFGPDIHGKLLPREKRILINANKPKCEHVFTVLHEIGHYVLHVQRRASNRPRNWFLNRQWKIEPIALFASKVRRAARLFFNSDTGREWEADLWAMCALVYLKKFIGSSILISFLERHPEKRGVYRLAAYSSFWNEAKQWLARSFSIIKSLFRLAHRA